MTLPSGKQLQYTYIPELGNVVSSVVADDVTQTFSYDKRTGRLLQELEGRSAMIIYGTIPVLWQLKHLCGAPGKTWPHTPALFRAQRLLIRILPEVRWFTAGMSMVV
ncbi:hypothetical protein ACFQUX_29560 [Pantoea stewartii]